MALGPAARMPVVIGVTAATVAANLAGDRHIGSTIVLAICNAGEPWRAKIFSWIKT